MNESIIYFLKVSIIITLFINVIPSYGQVKVDTISRNYEKEIIDGYVYYIVSKSGGDTLRFKQEKYNGTNGLGVSELEGSKKIDDTHRLINNKIFNNNLEEVCPIEVDKVHGQIGSGFLVNKTDLLYFLDSECELTYIDSIGSSNVALLEKHFLVYSYRHKILDVYTNLGDKIKQFTSVRQRAIVSNKFVGVRTTKRMDTLRMHEIHTPEGEYMFPSYGVIQSNENVMFFKDSLGAFRYFLDGKELDLPGEVKRISFLPYNEIMLLFDNGIHGLYSESLDEILAPNYARIYFIRWDNRLVNLKVVQNPDKDFIAAIDAEFNFKLFDLQGIPIELHHPIKFKALPFYLPISVFRIDDKFSFVALKPDETTFHLYDSEFNFVVSESKDSTDVYFFDQRMQGMPLRCISNFENESRDIDFYEVRLGEINQRNIVDRNFNPVFERELSYIEQISKDHFIVSRSFSVLDSHRKRGYVVKLSYE